MDYQVPNFIIIRVEQQQGMSTLIRSIIKSNYNLVIMYIINGFRNTFFNTDKWTTRCW